MICFNGDELYMLSHLDRYKVVVRLLKVAILRPLTYQAGLTNECILKCDVSFLFYYFILAMS